MSQRWKQIAAVSAMPVAFFAIGMTVLANLLVIRAGHDTSYNDSFAIPVALLLVVLSLVDGLTALLKALKTSRRTSIPVAGSRLLSRKELVFAVLVGIYVCTIPLSFVFSTIVFLLLAPAVLSLPSTIHADGSPRSPGRIVSLRWIAVVLGFVACMYVTFVLGLRVPLT